MCAAPAAAALHRVAEDIDHQLGVHDAAADDVRHKRAAHIVHRAELEGLVDIGAARLPLFQLLPAKQQKHRENFP